MTAGFSRLPEGQRNVVARQVDEASAEAGFRNQAWAVATPGGSQEASHLTSPPARSKVGRLQGFPPTKSVAMTTYFKPLIKVIMGTSLVAQGLRICLSVQGTWVRFLVWEDPTCRGATKLACHNC